MISGELVIPEAAPEMAGLTLESAGAGVGKGLEGAAPFVMSMLDYLSDFDPGRQEEALAQGQARGFIAPDANGVFELTPEGQRELYIYLNCA